MRGPKRRHRQFHLLHVALAVAALSGIVAPAPLRAEEPGWQARAQVLYDPDTATAERVMVRVMDMFPAYSLDFTWEPARGNGPGIDRASGAATGEGRLVWRMPGLPSYDPRSVFAVYQGRLVNGRPEGTGRLTLRSGERYEGDWVDGLRAGKGYLRDADGNHYQGDFAAGLPHGDGVQTLWDGTSYTGPFRHGLRHGSGRIRLPGGTDYASTWDLGREVDSEKPDTFADALTGGLLKAQSGDDASRVALAPVIDERMSARQAFPYVLQPAGTSFVSYPGQDDLVAVWNAQSFLGVANWEDIFLAAPVTDAMFNLTLASQDGGAVEIDRIWLDVSESLPVLRPMLSLYARTGCIGYQPYFALANRGWGPVERAVLRFRFVKPGWYETPEEIPAAGSQMFETHIDGFTDTTPVVLEEALRLSGVDIDRLRTLRYTCSRDADWEYCETEARGQADFGALAPYVGIYDRYMALGVDGEIELFWTDAHGQEQSLRQNLFTRITLLAIENLGTAEMGAVWNDFADAPSHLLADLPPVGTDYEVKLKYRGERKVVRLDVPIKIRSASNSIHNFRAAVGFRDGSIRYSQPVQLFYMRPRMDVSWQDIDAMFPEACFLEY